MSETLRVDDAEQSFRTRPLDVLAYLDRVDDEEQAQMLRYSLLKNREELRERYHLGEVIGQGGMKRILRVYDRVAARDVAMAVLHGLNSDDQVEQFVAEARTTARLEHPNIMPIYDIGLDEDSHAFFTMKLMRGQSLQQLLRTVRQEGRARSDGDWMDIFLKICDGLAYAHSQGILHLDLKPGNIQVGDYGEVMVCDWGLSRYRPPISEAAELDAQAQLHNAGPGRLTLSGAIHGSPGYMAPEQISLPRSELTPAADIYALGVILYELLTLELPYEADSNRALLAATLQGDLVPLRRRQPGISSALEAICLRALALDPQQRYASVEELRQDVRAYRDGYATKAENASFLRHAALLALRHRLATAVLGVSFCLLTVQGWLFVAQLRKAERETRAHLEQLQEAERSRRASEERSLGALRQASTAEAKSLTALPGMLEAVGKKLKMGMPPALQAMKAMSYMSALNWREAAAAFRLSQIQNADFYGQFCERQAAAGKAVPADDQILILVQKLHSDGYDLAVGSLLACVAPHLEGLEHRRRLAKDILRLTNPGLQQSQIPDLTGKSVSLAGLPVHRVEALVLLPLLELDLSGTVVKDLSCLRIMPLEILNLRRTPFSDLMQLSSLSLRRLDLAESKVYEIGFFQAAGLEELDLRGCPLSSLEGIPGLHQLRRLQLDDSPVLRRWQEQAPPACQVEWGGLETMQEDL